MRRDEWESEGRGDLSRRVGGLEEEEGKLNSLKCVYEIFTILSLLNVFLFLSHFSSSSFPSAFISFAFSINSFLYLSFSFSCDVFSKKFSVDPSPCLEV